MKPPPFDYHSPETVGEAISLLGAFGESAKVLAGGQSLLPLMNLRLASPENLIDLNKVRGLNDLRSEGTELVIGAMTRHRTLEVSTQIAQGWPLLAMAAPCIGHRAIRNRGTIGGSLAHADPAAELPTVAVCLGARVCIAGPNGTREVPAGEFFTDYFTTLLAADELISEVRFPAPRPRSGYAWVEFARRHGDFALVGVAASTTLAPDGTYSSATITYAGVHSTPFAASGAASLLLRKTPDEHLFAEVANQATADCHPQTDLHASAAYRRHLAMVLTHRALREASNRAGVANDA